MGIWTIVELSRKNSNRARKLFFGGITMIIKNAYVFDLGQGFVKKDTVIRDGYFSEEQALSQI